MEAKKIYFENEKLKVNFTLFTCPKTYITLLYRE